MAGVRQAADLAGLFSSVWAQIEHGGRPVTNRQTL
jgi:hypothetical protein